MAALCGAKTRAGGTCGHPKGWGTESTFGRCKMHGGATPSGRQFAAKEAARAEAARLGAELPLSAHEALELSLALVAGEVSYLRAEVRKLDAEDDLIAVDHPTLRAFAGAVDRLARVGQIAASVGVEERRLQLDSLVLERIASALRAALSEVELTPEQREGLRLALGKHLATLNDLTPRELAA